MAQDPKRTDRRRARTRAALLAAGHKLFAARSVDAVSIDEIVEAADVAKGSFYNHFDDKEGLAREIADQVRAAVEQRVAAVNLGVTDPAERVARAVCAFARNASEHPQQVRVLTRLFAGASIPDLPMDRGVRADVRDGLATGRFSGLPLEAAVLMAVGVAQVAVGRVLQADAAVSPPAVARDLAFGLLRGLGLDPEAARHLAARAAAEIFDPPS
jgi:AcrR family transcriptional regulator